MPATNLRALDKIALGEYFKSLGEPTFRARQVFSWLHGRYAVSPSDMTDLPKHLRDKLSQTAYIPSADVANLQRSSDGTTKFLLQMSDGALIESVLLYHDYGISACVSSQVGCRMGCAFCASTVHGLMRNLQGWEIEEQIIAMARALKIKAQPDADTKRVSSIVVMGSGEPLENLDEVVRFVELANDKDGLAIGMRHVTISTCGLPDKMSELAKRLPQTTIAVSLHAPTDDLRNQLMPINRRYPLDQLMAACRRAVLLTGRRISFEYALISGVNDSQHQALQLADLVSDMLCHINLIPLNPVSERGYSPSSPDRVNSFKKVLVDRGLQVTVRRELGRDIDAACGQLRRRAIEMDKAVERREDDGDAPGDIF